MDLVRCLLLFWSPCGSEPPGFTGHFWGRTQSPPLYLMSGGVYVYSEDVSVCECVWVGEGGPADTGLTAERPTGLQTEPGRRLITSL